jgi:hypothetical protein
METATTTTGVPHKKTPPAFRSGVDTPALLARITAVGVQPELAKRHGVSMCSLAGAFLARR